VIGDETMPAVVVDGPMSARAVLLQALSGKPGYGLELAERVERCTRGKVRLGRGSSLYSTLRDMVADGLVDTCVGEPRVGAGRPRHYYRLTDLGDLAAREVREVVGALLGLSVRNPGSG
jgi:DNA-binding PadR family transcriptional regulator